MMDNANFEYDVFISYTHLDNKPLNKDEEEGWISRFHYSFNIRLAQLLGREPKIWRDNKLHGNDEFSDEIIARLNKAKVLLTVISPRYLGSQWCMKELDLFLEAAEKGNIGDRIGNKSRVFKIIKTYVPYDRHPDELRGLNGYEFCELDEKENINEFNSEKGSEYEKKYWKRGQSKKFLFLIGEKVKNLKYCCPSFIISLMNLFEAGLNKRTNRLAPLDFIMCLLNSAYLKGR